MLQKRKIAQLIVNNWKMANWQLHLFYIKKYRQRLMLTFIVIISIKIITGSKAVNTQYKHWGWSTAQQNETIELMNEYSETFCPILAISGLADRLTIYQLAYSEATLLSSDKLINHNSKMVGSWSRDLSIASPCHNHYVTLTELEVVIFYRLELTVPNKTYNTNSWCKSSWL